ncbi:DUF1604-domain-containing protein [Auriculariales sp. MPI-PUGE-AT-0066]|nr:DUF1604-domain-containing protein [Auriculariales sp. MPI-PUGE-AT-0066]
MSKLKRKLENAFDGSLPSNLKLNENFCLIGTPLPSLDQTKDKNEFVPVWKQDVRDEKGRRRLHGAFTGGFSAGYFNTVGSKEGWAPQTFVSSRSDRASRKQARPEDFMDDEDLAEMRDAQKLVDTAEQMDLTGGTEAELKKRSGDDQQDDLASALESALLPSTKDSVGAQILKKMGWRPGQGVGPRVSWKQLNLQDMRSSNLNAAEIANISLDDHDEASKHTYAPRDTKLPVFQPKKNAHGLGYAPGPGLHDGTQSSRPGPTISTGFGLGALNDADDDDVDIYEASVGPSRTRQLAYDETDLDGPSSSKHTSSRKPAEVTTALGGPQLFQDGRRVISGFAISTNKVSEDLVFPISDIPPGWKPDPTRVWKEDKAVDAPPPPAVQNGDWKKTITADQRGAMLGEAPLPTAPRSVFDYLSQKDRDRLRALATGLPDAAPPPPVDIIIPTIDARTAQAALKGFQPFTADVGKQARYTEYLQSQATSAELVLKPRLDQGNEAFNHELAEYAKAAQIFKPVSGAMASRFTSASVVEQGPKAVEGLHQPSATSLFLSTPGSSDRQDEVKLQDPPKVAAAKAGIFGPMTRETEPWYPARLLCKRFGIRDPHPDGAAAEAAVQTAADKQSQFEAETKRLAATAQPLATSTGEENAEQGGEQRKRDLSNVGLGEDETQGRDTLTYERPAMDIFKAIFASDDESDDEDDGPAADAPTVGATITQPPAVAPATAAQAGPLKSAEAPVPKEDEQPVDLATFKPTFVSRAQREAREGPSETPDKHRKHRDKDKREKKKFGLVSFGGDEDGVEGPSIAPAKSSSKRSKDKEKDKDKNKDRHRKKHRRDSKPGEDGEEDAMWVEADTPDVVKSMTAPAPGFVEADPAAQSSRPPAAHRGRKRAIDFL